MRINSFTIIGLLVIFSGCSTVRTLQPVGTLPMQLNAEDWDGEWDSGDGTIFLKVKDAEKGILRAAIVDSEDTKTGLVFKLVQFDIFLKKGIKRNYANIRYKDVADDEMSVEAKDLSYVWFMIKKDSKRIFLCEPETDIFKSLQEAGTLKGINEEDSLILKDSSEVLTKFLDEHAHPCELFDWTDPLVLTKKR